MDLVGHDVQRLLMCKRFRNSKRGKSFQFIVCFSLPFPTTNRVLGTFVINLLETGI